MRTTSKLAFAVAGAGFALTGTVLLIRAAWGAIALSLGAVWASAIVGAALALIGGVLLLTAQKSHRPPPPVSTGAALFGAFFEGLRAGQASRARAR